MNTDQADMSRPHRERRTAVVMFADMVGYSSRLEQDEERNSLQTDRSLALFRSLIGDYGGHVANIAGDGILALFDDAERALRFAMQVQTEFRDQAVWSDGQPIQFRIGLNIGEVLIKDGNVQGHCVNIAARLQTLADPGEIRVAPGFSAAVEGAAGISLRSLGYQSLKNISEPIEVFTVGPVRSPAEPAEQLRPEPEPALARHPSIAVLALTNLSGDPANDHLCEGIVEDLIVNLSRFRSLSVIARRSSFLFSLRSQSAREIGRRLGVRYLLGGSLRRMGKRMRIGVELTEAETESVLWSDHFDIALPELFDMQDEITGAVASRLAVQIDFAERRKDIQHPPDLRAYGLVIRGQQLVLQFSREANAHARRLFEEAIHIAPDYGRAFSAVSRTHNLDWRYSWSPDPDASLDAAVEVARQALQLDRLDARGFAELGFAYLYKKRHDESLAEYERALTLNPNDADIIAEYADALVYAGRPEQTLTLIERAMQLNPYYPDWYLWYRADAYNAMGRPADVIATVLRMQDPSEGRRLLAANFAHLGMVDEARAQAREMLRLHPDFTIGRWRMRPPYRDQAILERYMDGLRKAGLPD